MMTAAQVEAKEFAFVTAIYRDPVKLIVSRHFIVGTPFKNEAYVRARAFAVDRWGEPHQLYVYPRTYIRDARRLFADGMHD